MQKPFFVVEIPKLSQKVEPNPGIEAFFGGG
jgi:hypothetical protein